MGDILEPPENFAIVSPGIFRSGFPGTRNASFLKHIQLRSVLTLVPEEIPEVMTSFYRDNSIKLYQIGVPGNKEPFVDIPEDKIAEALGILLDKTAHPLLIHCNKGKHRTGCLVGCLRKIQNWSITSACEEYRRFAAPSPRSLDQLFIEVFDISRVRYYPSRKPEWLA